MVLSSIKCPGYQWNRTFVSSNTLIFQFTVEKISIEIVEMRIISSDQKIQPKKAENDVRLCVYVQLNWLFLKQKSEGTAVQWGNIL